MNEVLRNSNVEEIKIYTHQVKMRLSNKTEIIFNKVESIDINRSNK